MDLSRMPLSKWPEESFYALRDMVCQSTASYAAPGNSEAFLAVSSEARRRTDIRYGRQPAAGRSEGSL